MNRIPVLTANPADAFPPVEEALSEPNGLLAAGGDLSVTRLLEGYRRGIFPWYSIGEPILWWSPDPRMVFDTGHMHIPQRLRHWLKHCDWTVRADHAFRAVMKACAQPRRQQAETWITDEILAAYCALHEQGHAHSVEVYENERLVGGIYGVAIGRMFFGESMFSVVTHGSKVALLALCRALHAWGFPLLDAQASSDHLRTLGAYEMPRSQFGQYLQKYCAEPASPPCWKAIFPLNSARNLA